ncbi:hypothetical protein A2U01_0025106 [Trifolium medium]|uniref:Uncharacterized protein n=1 Tax=Trifolium medium TaxID=97028 RepID=A0A392NX87_9FABA|nr:hypothetical protein [Trifolium medium]
MHSHNLVFIPITKTLDRAMLAYCWDYRTPQVCLQVSLAQLQLDTYSKEVLGMMCLRFLLHCT